MGVTIIVVAAVLNEVISFATFTYSKQTVRQQTAERTKEELKELERINDLKARVESAVMATVGAVEENMQNRQEMYRICTRLVDRNKHIIGSAVALRPGFYQEGDSAFAAFAFQTADAMPVTTKQLPYEYEEWEWYKEPTERDSVWWSEPYRDTGGSDMLIYTFSAPIHNYRHECIGVLTGDINFKDMVFRSHDDSAMYDRLRLWTLLSQLVSIVLILLIVWRSSRSIRKVNALMTEQKLLSQELQIASDIQGAMLPLESVQENARHHLDVRVKLLSASDVSADLYDYFYAGHSLVFCLGDVPGCNVRASVMMAVTRSVFRTAATAVSSVSDNPSPAAIVTAMNRSLSSINDNEMFTTLFVGVLNLDTARLTYCNAGHPWPVILNPHTGTHLLELKPNIPIGIVEDFTYEEQQVTLIDDFTLFLYTDGLYETENVHGETFGTKRMMARLKKSAEKEESPEKIIDRMTTDVENFRGFARRIDDAVMVAIKAICMAAVLLGFGERLMAQESVDVTLGADVVSQYVWRGLALGHATVQPSLGVSWHGLSLTAEGAVGITDSEDAHELDLTAQYTTGGLSVGIVDYWSDTPETRYFYYNAHGTSHVFEGFVGYDWGVCSLSWQTIFAGNDGMNKSGKRAYSSYVEACVPFRLARCDWQATAGLVPYATDYYETTGLAVTVLSLKATRDLKLSRHFTVPVFAELVGNPCSQRAYFVFGFTLSPE